MGVLRAKFPEGLASRVLSKQAAEVYCGMSLEMFYQRFGKKIPAMPARNGERFYDRQVIEKIIEEISSGASPLAPHSLATDKKLLWTAAEAAGQLSMSRARFRRDVAPFVLPAKSPGQVSMKRPRKMYNPNTLKKFIGVISGESEVDPVLEAEERAVQRMRRARAAAENRRAAG